MERACLVSSFAIKVGPVSASIGPKITNSYDSHLLHGTAVPYAQLRHQNQHSIANLNERSLDECTDCAEMLV